MPLEGLKFVRLPFIYPATNFCGRIFFKRVIKINSRFPFETGFVFFLFSSIAAAPGAHGNFWRANLKNYCLCRCFVYNYKC